VSADGQVSTSDRSAQDTLSPEERMRQGVGQLGVDGACGAAGGCPDPTATPGAAVTPEQVAETLSVRVAGRLPEPEVLSNPDPGVPVIINTPVFVEVLNWQAVFTDSSCDGTLCVTVTATPRLTFDPGEKGADPVACEGAGDRYDPDSDLEPNEQAEGACAYIYQLRTGTPGRPKKWPGRAVVSWAVNWTASDGDGGTLPAVEKVADLPKAVVEIQALLVDPDDPADGR
jgi:hypothetical protein